jgi:hypothetical protein
MLFFSEFIPPSDWAERLHHSYEGPSSVGSLIARLESDQEEEEEENEKSPESKESRFWVDHLILRQLAHKYTMQQYALRNIR